ncbi:MAG: mechanosensitive ion channel [Lentisphaerae bacterium]|nr:mechanosensitive ion channel [Lentisphaerota bacterium]
MSEPMLALSANIPAILALALLAVFLLGILLRVLGSRGYFSRAAANVFLLALLALICEGVRQRTLLPLSLTAWLKGLELLLLALLAVQLIVKLYIEQYLERRRKFVARIVRDLTTVLIIALFALLFLRVVLNVSLMAILTQSAILTAVIGLAMQDTIGNFISGLIIQIEKPFDLNDWIEIDGQRGQVREINWRYTKIETEDRIYMIIPNNKIAAEKLINYSKPTLELKEFITIGVGYEVPPVKVKQAVLAILKANSQVIRKEESEVFLHAYGDSSIVYRIGYMISNPGLRRDVQDEIYSAIWYQFKKHLIEIPYPIRTLIMKPPGIAGPDVSESSRLLARLELFAGASPEALEHLVRFGLSHTIAPGQMVVQDQEPGDSMFFILDGDFNVIKNQRISAVLHKGDFFGEMSLLTGEKRAARVEAATGGTLLEIERSAFKIIVATEPAIMRQIEAIFAQRAAANVELARDKTDPEAVKAGLWQRFKKRFGLA